MPPSSGSHPGIVTLGSCRMITTTSDQGNGFVAAWKRFELHYISYFATSSVQPMYHTKKPDKGQKSILILCAVRYVAAFESKHYIPSLGTAPCSLIATPRQISC